MTRGNSLLGSTVVGTIVGDQRVSRASAARTLRVVGLGRSRSTNTYLRRFLACVVGR
jgi:hypothetical protein